MSIEQLRNEKFSSGDGESLSIKLKGEKIGLPAEFVYREFYDACSNSFELLDYPMEKGYNNFNLSPGGLEEISIAINNETVLIGNVEILKPTITPNRTSISICGRSKARILEKSALPENIQREFIDMSLSGIGNIVCRAFGLTLKVDEGINAKKIFKRATYSDSSTAYEFFARLCKESGLIFTSDNLGNPLITKIIKSNPVARFDLDSDFVTFLGVESVSVEYDSTKIFGKYVAKTQTPLNELNIARANSKVIKENSITYLSFDDSTSGTLKSMVDTHENKTVRSFFSNTIPFPSWINPANNQRWKTGQSVVINASKAFMNETVLNISAIDFVRVAEKETAILNLIPVEAYE